MNRQERKMYISQQSFKKVKLSLNRDKKPLRQAGFTLVELLIVIVVIAILAAITIIAYNGITAKAHVTALESTLAQNVTLLGAYNAQNGTYPTDDGTSASLKTSTGITLTYTGVGAGYCLQAAGWGQTYNVTDNNTSPAVGTCAPMTGNFPSDLNLISVPSDFTHNSESTIFTTLFKITAKQNVKLTGIRMYAYDTSALTGYVLTGDGTTRTVVATSNTLSTPTINTWNTVTFSTPYSLTAGQSVWVGAQINGGAAYYYDSDQDFFSNQHVQNSYLDVAQGNASTNYTWGNGLTSGGTAWGGWNAVDVTWSSS